MVEPRDIHIIHYCNSIPTFWTHVNIAFPSQTQLQDKYNPATNEKR